MEIFDELEKILESPYYIVLLKLGGPQDRLEDFAGVSILHSPSETKRNNNNTATRGENLEVSILHSPSETLEVVAMVWETTT